MQDSNEIDRYCSIEIHQILMMKMILKWILAYAGKEVGYDEIPQKNE